MPASGNSGSEGCQDPAAGRPPPADRAIVPAVHAPPFSVFSAVSELLVTAGVLFVVRRNWTRRLFPFPLFLAVTLFEACVNVLYMASRASRAAVGAETLGPGMRIAFALHGMLSLFAFAAFVVLGVLAHQDQKRGRWFFRERPVLTWIFLAVWIVSVGSGEALFAARYLF